MKRIDPPDNIEKVKLDIRKCGENIKQKYKVEVVSNAKLNLGYIKYPKTDTPGMTMSLERIHQKFLEMNSTAFSKPLCPTGSRGMRGGE